MKTAPLILATVLLLGVAGCSHMTVRHLALSPWAVEAPGQVELRFWRFDYTTVPADDGYLVQGVAMPLESIPQWATWAEELWLATYLADGKGRVRAQASQEFNGRYFRPSGLPFSFLLKAPPKAGEPLFITFGYRMAARQAPREPVQGGQQSPDAGEIFFASESALTRY